MSSLTKPFFFILLTLLACEKPLTLAEYGKWASTESTELTRFEKSGKVEFRAKYIPPEYQCLLQNPEARESSEVFDSLKTLYLNQVFFTFDMYVNHGSNKTSIFTTTTDEKEYADMNRYMLESQGRFKLLLGKDTLYPVYFQLERTYDLTPYNTMHLAFSLPPDREPESMKLIYEEDWFNLGRLQFAWTTETLNKIPELKL